MQMYSNPMLFRQKYVQIYCFEYHLVTAEKITKTVIITSRFDALVESYERIGPAQV